MKKKIDIFKDILKSKIKDFKCPICKNSFILDEYSLICTNKHVFDINKKGYINFQPKNKHKQYNKEMFEDRNRLSEASFYDPLIKQIIRIIENYQDSDSISILDIGAGGGYHLYKIKESLSNANNIYIGMDISSDAVGTASKYYNNILWCVNDAENIALKDRSIDVIINILSPINYKETGRILKDNGIFIKILPEKNYLKELREYFFKGTVKEEYSNAKVFNLLQTNMNILKTINVQYKAKISEEQMKNLVSMTPLTSGIQKEEINKFIKNNPIKEISVDLKICICEK